MRASRQNSIGEASKDPALPAIGAPAVERVQQEFAEIRPSCHDLNYMPRRRWLPSVGRLQNVLRVLISMA